MALGSGAPWDGEWGIVGYKMANMEQCVVR